MCPEKVMGWMRTNKMKLNTNKTEVLLVNKEATVILWKQPDLEKVGLPLKEQICSLRVILVLACDWRIRSPPWHVVPIISSGWFTSYGHASKNAIWPQCSML